MSGPIGIALIGMGWWGQKMLNVLQAAPAEIRVVRAVESDTVGAYGKFRGGGTSYVWASLANRFISRFAVYSSKRWVEIRDKSHVEAPDGWIVTSAVAGGPITTADVPPAEPVKDNFVSFAHAVRRMDRYPITADQLVNNIALLEAVFASARSGKIENVA
jgi:predicted dehydrogenase